MILLLLTTSCRPEPMVIKVGLVAPFEGRQRPVGYDAVYAARLAVREQNAAGGIGPYRVSLVAMDDGGEADQAVEVAQSMALDEDVLAVVGHWLPETSTSGATVYATSGMPFIVLGKPPFAAFAVEDIPAEFANAYATETPFDETAGSYSAPTYDALKLLFAALEQAAETGPLTRERVQQALAQVSIEGLTGRVYVP